MIIAENMPDEVRERIIAAHSEQPDHAFDCLTPMIGRVAEMVSEGESVGRAIRWAAVKHSQSVRWTRDNVGLD